MTTEASERPGSAERPSQAAAIMRRAEAVFARQGYHGTTVRQLSREAGISQPLIYHYFPSKHDLLETIMNDAVDFLVRNIEAALESSPPDPAAQLASLVATHVLHEVSHQRSSFVANTELRSLDEPARGRFIAKRDHVQGIYDRVVLTAVESGVARTPYPKDTARAIATMCTAVSTWFRKGGALSADEVAQRYSTMALFTAGIEPEGGMPK